MKPPPGLISILMGMCIAGGCLAQVRPDHLAPVTEELRNIVAADQREPPVPPGAPADRKALEQFYRDYWNRHFRPRHDRVLEFVQQGRLSSGEDFFLAGTIVNHSPDSADNLLAHALFSVAAFKGYRAARWASAAALDNYLVENGKPQLFGTIYGSFGEPLKDRSNVMREPMTDAVRREFCVPSLAKQEELLEYLKDGNRSAFAREKAACPNE